MAHATIATNRVIIPSEEHRVTTLLDVVNAVAEEAADDCEAVAVILHMLASGRVKLLGEFTERDFGFL